MGRIVTAVVTHGGAGAGMVGPLRQRRTAADAWIGAWAAAAPRSRPAEALRIAEPLAHLAYAVRYQEFLDNIEPSERVYHRGDPAASIRQGIAGARWTLSPGC